MSRVSSATCRNCSSPLTGPYCAQCGQHAHESARSLHAVLHEAWHIFTHVDGSFWRTLAALFTRPGFLTLEYFAEHRARYAPPFRLYFVVSVAFFSLSSLASHTQPTNIRTPGAVNIRVESVNQAEQDLLPSVAVMQDSCNSMINTGRAGLDRRLRTLCSHQVADRGQSLFHEFTKLLPKMMFVFLPLMAAVMMLVYHSRHHYYVEHLVFLLHTQTAVFLLLLANTLSAVISSVLPQAGQEVLMPIISPLLMIYSAWYVYAALRRFYGEGRGITFGKYVLLSATYLVLVGLFTAVTFVLSALVT